MIVNPENWKEYVMSKLGWIVAIQGIVIAVLLVVLITGGGTRYLQAQQVFGGDRLQLQPVHLQNVISIAYVLDSRNRRLCVYEYEYKQGLRLLAVRNIQWDLKMESYKALSPEPSKVRDNYFKSQENKR